MEKNQKITYYLGAGASYSAIPILNHLGTKMIDLAKLYTGKEEAEFVYYPAGLLSEDMELLYDIGYFGKKALEYSTIDIYARKLHLNNSSLELQRLKLALSAFFTIWQLCDDILLKSFGDQTDIEYEPIDKRYLKLMSTILEKNVHEQIAIKDNIKFITWNYDLQLEYSFKKFLDDSITWDQIPYYLNFNFSNVNINKVNVCHLNGYHGYYKSGKSENNILERAQSSHLRDIVDSIKFIVSSQRQGSVDFSNYITYAWENAPIIGLAEEIMRNTEILVVIGYSFPEFNREIDSKLFNSMITSGNLKKIYYQSHQADEGFLRRTFNIPGKMSTKDDPKEVSIEVENTNMLNFIF